MDVGGLSSLNVMRMKLYDQHKRLTLKAKASTTRALSAVWVFCSAVAFPAVTNDSEGVNLRCHFWGVTLTKTLAANGGNRV